MYLIAKAYFFLKLSIVSFSPHSDSVYRVSSAAVTKYYSEQLKAIGMYRLTALKARSLKSSFQQVLSPSGSCRKECILCLFQLWVCPHSLIHGPITPVSASMVILSLPLFVLNFSLPHFYKDTCHWT